MRGVVQMTKNVSSKTYDLVIVGGGLGGSALAKMMAEQGASVVVLESEVGFRDRVRGEGLQSWGAQEARELGIYDILMSSCGHELFWLDNYQGQERISHRDLIATTRHSVPAMTYYHPEMQEVLTEAATVAGAEVLRGARVQNVEPDDLPIVTAVTGGREVKLRAQLVVGADGRASRVRSQNSFSVHRDPDRLFIAGLLFDDMPAPANAISVWSNTAVGQRVLLLPQGSGRVRTYLIYPAERGYRLSGKGDIASFVEECVRTGAPEHFFKMAHSAGPLATFSGAATWVEHPFQNNVVVVGDAASSPDPSFGQGMSVALRDVRVLKDMLIQHEDWDEVGNAYAKEHARYFGVVHTFDSWATQLLHDIGPEADAHRARVFALWEEDSTRNVDVAHSGPDITLDEVVRRRYFGEDRS